MLCLPFLFRKRPREALVPLGFLVVSLITYGTYAAWFGGSSWGPRYLVPILPYLLWPLMELGWFGPRAADAAARTNRLPSVGRIALVFLVVVSAGVQVLGVIVNFATYGLYWELGPARVSGYQNMLAASPLLMAIWLIPMMIRFTFTNVVPVAGYAPANYPFGPPLPPNVHAIHVLDPYSIQYFWFTLLPHPLVWAIAGAVVFGGGMVLAGRQLLRRLREDPQPRVALGNERISLVAGQRG